MREHKFGLCGKHAADISSHRMSHVALSPPYLVFAIETLANVAAWPPMLQVLGIPCGFVTAIVSMRLVNHGEEFLYSEAVDVVVMSFVRGMYYARIRM